MCKYTHLSKRKSVSRIRQPIESLFNWIQEKTDIQVASKVRSSKGLMVHIFGRLAYWFLTLNWHSLGNAVTEQSGDHAFHERSASFFLVLSTIQLYRR